MKSTVISHPFRNIVLEYENESTFTALERNGLDAYRRLHDLTFRLRQSVYTLHHSYAIAARALADHKARFIEVEEACQPLHAWFRHLVGISGKNWKQAYTVKAQVKPVLLAYQAFYESYMPFFEAVMARDREYDTMRTLLEETEEALQYFAWYYFPAITGLRETPHIDAGSLDKDFDDYRLAYASIIESEGRLIDLRNALVEDLKVFVVKVNNTARLLHLAKEQHAGTKAVLN